MTHEDDSEAVPIVFVTGAPRPGTTFVSDWISQAAHAYCAHEISREVARLTDRQIFDYLRQCAQTGEDRGGKTGLDDYLRGPNAS